MNFLFGWLPVIKKPKWLIKSVEKYIYNYEKKYKILPYDVIKHFYGKTFVYKVIFEAQGHGFVKPIYYKKYRIIESKKTNWLRKILILIGLKKIWICIKCKELKLITDVEHGGVYLVKYKLKKGKYTKKRGSSGSPDDNGYEGYYIFKPKSRQTKILVWITRNVGKKIKIKRFIVILNKKYKRRACLYR